MSNCVNKVKNRTTLGGCGKVWLVCGEMDDLWVGGTTVGWRKMRVAMAGGGSWVGTARGDGS